VSYGELERVSTFLRKNKKKRKKNLDLKAFTVTHKFIPYMIKHVQLLLKTAVVNPD